MPVVDLHGWKGLFKECIITNSPERGDTNCTIYTETIYKTEIEPMYVAVKTMTLVAVSLLSISILTGIYGIYRVNIWNFSVRKIIITDDSA